MADNNDFFKENFDDIFEDETSDNANISENSKEEILNEGTFEFEADKKSDNFDFGDMSDIGLDINSFDFDEENNNNEEKIEENNSQDVEAKKSFKVSLPKVDVKKSFKNFKSEIASYKNIKNLTEKKFYMILKVFLMVFVLLIFGATTLQRRFLKQKVEKDIVNIKQSNFVANLPSYIFINETFIMDGNEVLLKKMLVDADATILFFELGYNDIDVKNYTAYILDENNKYYGVKSDEIDLNSDGFAVSLKRLNEDIKEFTLHIVNIYNGNDAVIPFKMDNPVKIPNGKYVNDEVLGKDSNGISSFSLINAVFSPAYSSLDFLLENNNGGDYAYVLGYGEPKDKIFIYEGGRDLRNIKSTEKTYEIDDVSADIIKVNFNAVKSLQSTITIVIKEIYKSYSVNQIFDTRPLLNQEIEDYHTISIDEYNINLEGMRRFNDKIVLVAHAVDTLYYDKLYPVVEVEESNNIYDPAVEQVIPKIDTSDPMANRVEIYLDSTLLVHKSGEEPFELKGEIKTSNIGTDIIFTDERLKNTTSADYDLRIDNILFKQDDLEVRLDLSKLDNSIDIDTERYTNFIEDTMISRLQYKGRQRVLSSIEGFSSSVLNSSIMSLYEPVDVITPARYDVQINTYVYRNNMFIAIVEEQWNGITEEGIIHYEKVHEIRVRESNGELEIFRDIIISEDYSADISGIVGK